MEKIYVKGGENCANILELLVHALDTSDYFFKETFSNPEYTIRQCHEARRSTEDLLSLCCTYFPDTTEEDLGKVLLQMHQEHGLSCFYCGDINRFVWLKNYNELFNERGYNTDQRLMSHSIYNKEKLKQLLGI